MAGLFQVLWGQADGTFLKAETLTGTDGEPLMISVEKEDSIEGNPLLGNLVLETICTRPTAVDWDGDGDLDLVVGNFGGSFYLFHGEGEGNFNPAAEPLLANGEPLKIKGQHSDPFVVDWDADGDLDLLSGSSSGGVQWAENKAGAASLPELEPFVALIEPSTPARSDGLLYESDLTGPNASTRIWIDDVNTDGKLDILVGDSTRLVSPVEGLSEEDYVEKLAAWKNEMEESLQVYRNEQLKGGGEAGSDERDSEESKTEQTVVTSWLAKLFGLGNEEEEKSDLDKAMERYRELSQQQSEFMKTEATGYVWLYLQR